ncbi:hypothetical protein E2C01_063179 [Portunus trituberculatus]|uniref:Uncharacterized protein n=1 Tax=Portunus trituberculatus TaxID=210409 RepID=A0A5B7HG75_PORTR|nr:hypothetical protein [Portunus trituberculatus]
MKINNSRSRVDFGDYREGSGRHYLVSSKVLSSVNMLIVEGLRGLCISALAVVASWALWAGLKGSLMRLRTAEVEEMST